MAYIVRYTDEANKGTIIVEDNTINDSDTSLQLPGRNTTAYGTVVAENFLHLLENFASTSAPDNPTEGQLWYDVSPGENKQLRIYDGTNWVSAGNLKKGPTAPSVSQSIIGDLWSDTNNQQLYMFTGGAWILVGPKFSDGLETGAEAEILTGTDDIDYVCLVVRVNAEAVSIISNSEFTPKATIPGFTLIKPGINLSTRDVNGDGAPKFLGTSEKAENLIVGTETVAGGNFLRGDATSTSNFPIRIKNNAGLTVGSGSQFKVGVEGDKGILDHAVNGSSMNIRMNNAGTTQTALTVLSNTNIGIGKENPAVKLDVNGDTNVSGLFQVLDNTQSISISTGSGTFRGGVGIARDLYVGGDTYIEQNLQTNAILPSLNNTHDIGTPTRKYENIYATTFVGNLQGTVSGSISGRAGSADKLTTINTFNITGDVGLTTDPVQFDGSAQTGTQKVFNTIINQEFVRTKGAVQNLNFSDEVLISRTTTSAGVQTTGLKRVTVQNLFNTIPKTPVGAIMMYSVLNTSGEIVDDSGGKWLICDGREVLQTDYPELFGKIDFEFKDKADIEGPNGNDNGRLYFALPDLRARFPLGLANMQVTGALTDAVDPANDPTRVDSTGNKIIGETGGSPSKTIQYTNLPEHEHYLRSEAGDNFYAIAPNAPGGGSDTYNISAPAGGNTYKGIVETGNIVKPSGVTVGDPFDVVNPFMILNFIIYAGGSN